MTHTTKRIGLLASSLNAVMEPELYAMAPKDVTIHTSRMLSRYGGQATVQSATDLEIDLKDAIVRLPKVDLMVFGITVGSLVKGYGHDQDLIKKMIEYSGGIPATTVSTAVIDALKEMGAKNVSIGTPYRESLSAAVEKFVASHGFNVVKRVTLAIDSGHDIADTSEDQTVKLAKMADRPESDTVFISCTNLLTVSVLDRLETELKKPVISSTQATMWECLKILKVSQPIRGFGSLLNRPR